MPTNSVPSQELEAEVASLKKELKQKQRKNADLQQEVESLRRQIEAMRQQEASMAALFRGARPTLEGRRAHAEVTGR
jgi:uncharacterized protein YlxW (UPF0749 family)